MCGGGRGLPLWEPGAHIDLVLGDGLVRQYSLCGDPGDAAAWRIGVLKEGPGSTFVHERVQVGIGSLRVGRGITSVLRKRRAICSWLEVSGSRR